MFPLVPPVGSARGEYNYISPHPTPASENKGSVRVVPGGALVTSASLNHEIDHEPLVCCSFWLHSIMISDSEDENICSRQFQR